jgi:hypothetical protein
MRKLADSLAFSLCLATAPLAAAAADFTFTVRVPVTLGGTTYLPYQAVRWDGTAFSLAASPTGLGLGVQLDALDAQSDGSLLLSSDAPITPASATYVPGDLLRYSGGAYTPLSVRADLGLAASANITAVAPGPSAGLVVAFDAPETLATVTYRPTDLVLLSGSPYTASLFWSGAAAGLAAGSRIAGVDVLSATHFFLTFDSPVTVGGATYVPGDIVKVNSGSFSLYFRYALWPAGAVMGDFAFGSPGRVPNGADVPGTPLTLAKSVSGGAGDLDLSWGASCLSGSWTYGIYEGAIGSWYSHGTQAACGVTGTSVTITPFSGDRYYLVVPSGEVVEGSYGLTSAGNQRPASINPCRHAQRITPCP